MSKRLAKIADEIAEDRIVRAAEDYSDLRDRVDLATGGDLDCTQLDIVTGLVAHRRGIKAGA